MRMNYSKFPHFQLRCDFVDELCFYESVQQPMSRDKFEALGRQIIKAKGSLRTTYEEYCKQKEQPIPKRDIFGIYAFRKVASNNALCPTISDYWNRLYIAYDGLFQDVVAGVKEACLLGPDDPCPIFALATAPEEDGKRYPTHFVRHNTRTGLATILPSYLFEIALDPYRAPHHAKPTRRGSGAERQA